MAHIDIGFGYKHHAFVSHVYATDVRGRLPGKQDVIVISGTDAIALLGQPKKPHESQITVRMFKRREPILAPLHYLGLVGTKIHGRLISTASCEQAGHNRNQQIS